MQVIIPVDIFILRNSFWKSEMWVIVTSPFLTFHLLGHSLVTTSLSFVQNENEAKER